MSVQVEQCLHGYGDGHERLAASVVLPDTEAYLLDRMTDLSGYPGKEDPPPYLSGYPCGRWYAITKTWIDKEGKRRGTVFTHSILISINDISRIDDISVAFRSMREPSHPVDKQQWERPLLLPPAPCPAVDATDAALWFEGDGPLVWTGDAPEGAVRSVWASLPPRERADFRFCTHALQPRYLGDRLFDWTACPRSILLDYGSARQLLRERDRTFRAPAWLLAMAWPPDWAAIEQMLPDLGRVDRRAALRFMSLWKQGDHDALLGASDLLDRLRVAPGSHVADRLMRDLIDSAPEPTLSQLHDLMAREPLRWSPKSEELAGNLVHSSIARHARNLNEATVARLLDYPDSMGRIARDALRRTAPTWTDDQILSRIQVHPELIGEWVYSLPPERRRALVAASDGAARDLLIGDLRALERLIEPGDASWIDVALAVAQVRADDHGLQRVLRRVGPAAIITWGVAHAEVPPEVLDCLADDDALPHVLVCGHPTLLDAVLRRPNADEALRSCARHDPTAVSAAWRALVGVEQPQRHRSRIVRALLDAGRSSALFALLSEEEAPLAAAKPEDAGSILGAALRAGFGASPDPNALRVVSSPSLPSTLDKVHRRDWEWLANNGDTTRTAQWIAQQPLIVRYHPRLVLDLVKAWAQRGWPMEASDSLAQVVGALDKDRPTAAAWLLEACLRTRREADAVLVAATFPVVHGALLSDKTVLEGLRDLLTDHWNKAKVPRRALLRAWDDSKWPPSLLVEAFPDWASWRYFIDEIEDEMSKKGITRFIYWYRRFYPTRFKDLPRRLREFADS